jgi:tetratricopeptide (TPR) repeat protein
MDDSPRSDQTLDLSEAQLAYEMALLRLEEALPKVHLEPVVVDPTTVPWSQAVLRLLIVIPLALLRGVQRLAVGIRNRMADLLDNTKARLIRMAQPQPTIVTGPRAEQRNRIRMLLLEALWARDHVQEAMERRDGASYESKRSALTFVMANEPRLERLGQHALLAADLETGELRDSQPTEPPSDRWWWFLNLPRAKRARRMNTLWFVLAIVPAMASIVLITLLAQRLAINGPDLLSGASVVAQVGLGVGSILAGRELLNDLLLKGARVSWEGQLTFMLASLFLVVVVIFYFLAPPGAALVYHVFGQQAINAGNAAEAELYLESAARLDPDPHAAALLEVGCLYQTLGAPDRAQTVFERVLEADSRLLLARYHLAELYNDRREYDKALQLLEDGLTLLDAGYEDFLLGNDNFLPGIDTEGEFDQIEYLLRLARGRAYLESNAPEQAKTNLREAEDFYAQITASPAGAPGDRSQDRPAPDRFDLACGPDENRLPFVLGTELNLHYFLARTYDALCDDDATVQASIAEWRIVRNGRPANSRQEAWRDDAVRRLSSGLTCRENYGLVEPEFDSLPTRLAQ